MTSPQYYGTQPDAKDLPKVLPAGSRTLGHDEDFDAHALVRLEHFEHGERYVCDEGAGCCWCPPSHIDWSTVPLQPTPDRPGEDGEPRDETKAPVPLPEFLPAGTRFHYDSLPDPFEFTEGARLVDGDWLGSHVELTARRGRKPCGDPSAGANVTRIDWPSYYEALRRLSPAQEPTRAGGAKCPRCGSPDLCLIADKCNGCGVTGLELRVAKIRDPYRNTPEHTNPTAFAAYCLGENAKHAAMKEQHAADLDRSSAERRRVVARNERHWPAAWSSESWDEP